MADRVKFMSDNELRAKLAAHGLPVMPITATTRPLLVKKLKSVLVNNNCQQSCNHGTMADQVYSMSNAELRTRLAEYGYPTMPVTATTRKVLINKLISLIQNNNMRRVPSRNTNKENEIARLHRLIENQLAHGLMPVMSLDCIMDNKSRTDNDRPNLSHNMIRTPSNQSEIIKNSMVVPEPWINSSNNINMPRMTQEVLQTSSTQPIEKPPVFKFTSELPSFKPAHTENKSDGNRENAVRNMFQTSPNPSEASPSGTSNYNFAPDLSSIPKRNNSNDDAQGMNNMIQALTKQQEKGFQELLSNLNSKMHDIFENISNIQGENLKSLLSSINSSKQDLYQKLSEEQGKHFKVMLTNLTRIHQETVETLSQKQDEKSHALISSFRCTKEDMVQTLTKHQDHHFQVLSTNLKKEKEEIYEQLSNQQNKQFQELLSSLNFMKEQNSELSKRFESLTLKYDNVLEQVKNLKTENIEHKRYIEKLEEGLDLHEKKVCLSSLEIKIPKLKEEQFETKEHLCIFVKKLGKAVGVEIESSNIRDIYRLNNGESPVVIEFTTVLMKEALVSAIKRMNEQKLKDEQFGTKVQFLELPTSTLFFSIFLFISTLFALFLLCIL